jgi:hypothetical protein
VLARGTPVFSSDGERVGDVRKVLEVREKDIFDGLILRTPRGPRFVDAPEVASIHEDRVTLTIDAAGAARLLKPGQSPAAMSVDPDDLAAPAGAYRLRRIWDRITGRY